MELEENTHQSKGLKEEDLGKEYVRDIVISDGRWDQAKEGIKIRI